MKLEVLFCICYFNILHKGFTEDFCQSETFVGECRSNEMLVVKLAFYGRMKLGRCVESTLGYIDCYTDVLGIGDSLCSGRRSCRIGVPNSLMDSTQPCNKELKTYLQIEYSCFSVITPEAIYCSSSHPYQINQDYGFISNDLEGCNQHSWLIKVLPGQKIELQLYDFSTWLHGNRIKSDKPVECPMIYGYILEREHNVNQTICSTGLRTTILYISRSPSAEIFLHKFNEISFPSRFAVRFRSQGCADLNPPVGTQYSRVNDTASITCVDTDQSWHLRCVEANWHGVVGNCSSLYRHSRQLLYHEAYPIANLILIFIVITVAIVLATTILLVGVFIVKTKRPQPTTYTKYETGRSVKSYNYMDDIPRPSEHSRGQLNNGLPFQQYAAQMEAGESNLYAPILDPTPQSQPAPIAPLGTAPSFYGRLQIERTGMLPPPMV